MLLLTCTMAAAHADTVVLTRDDVIDAADIEAAIAQATLNNTVAGKVILDGSMGRFTFPDLSDQTIDITVSNLTLAGVNDAAVDAVIAFGSIEVSNVVVEGLEIRGPFEDGVAIISGPNITRNVTIRNNVISSQLSALFVSNASNWQIVGNTITSSADEGAGSVTLLGARGSELIGNTITSGTWGILLTSSPLREATGNLVIANRVAAGNRGIVLNGGAARNTLLLNRIVLAASSDTVTGIFLDNGTTRNKVVLNKAGTAEGGSLITIEDLGTRNKVVANRP
jgi:hypothetical protein